MVLVAALRATALADGGQVRVMQQQGDYQLTVFTSPNPLRAGPADVSILLQDTRTNQTVSDATITVELFSPDKAQPPIRAIATAGAATNKLLRAAIVELPAAGLWHIRVECATPQTLEPIAAAFDVVAAPPLPRWLTVWPWFTWPLAAVALFAIHRTLVAQRIRPS